MNYYSFIPLLGFIASIFTSAVVIGRNTSKPAHKSFLLFSLTLQVWSAADFIAWNVHDESGIFPVIKAGSVAWLLCGALFLNFIYAFLDKKRDLFYRVVFTIYISFVIVSLFTPNIVSGYEHRSWGVLVLTGQWFFPFIIFAIIPFFYALYLIAAGYRTSRGARRRQLLLLFIGTVVPMIIGLITDIVYPYVLNRDIVSLSSTASAIQSIFVFVALTRYRFLSIEIEDISEEIFSNVSDAVLILDTKGRVINHNAAASQLLGFKIGNEYLEKYMTGDYSSSSEYNNLEITINAERTERTVYLTQAPIRQLGYLTGRIVIMKDITLKKRMELELIDKNKELDIFVYKASHDLKGPLSSVKGLITLAKTSDAKSLVTYLNMIDKSIGRLDSVLLDLLQVTRIKKSDLKHEQLRLKKMTQDILDSLQYHSGFRHIAFDLQCNEKQPFFSDRNSLNSVLQNLIMNSINYRNAEAFASWVDIIINTSREGAEIVIADNGIGIPDEIQDKVFEMFYRGSTQAEGTGLGLYIVKSAVTKLGGNIQVESREGKGTRFVIFIPQGNVILPAAEKQGAGTSLAANA